ncbi:MAG: hypothetical protein R2827_06485 [Bdellovibrionales bacterium]
MSGMFKDRGFATDAIKKTKAVDYLFKPFNVDNLVDKIKTILKDAESGGVDQIPMSEFLTSNMDSSSERRKALDKVDSISGFDLPFAISILMDGESTGNT